MDEDKLIRISLAVAIAGLVVLFFLSQATVDTVTIERINKEALGSIRVVGQVGDLNIQDSYTTFTLSEMNNIQVIAFDRIELAEGEEVEVVGRSEEGQLIADRVLVR